MTRARLLALGAVVATMGAGTIVFVDWDSGKIVPPPPPPAAGFMFLGKDQCTSVACGTQTCQQANDLWGDAGIACGARVDTCDVKIGPGARVWAATNSITLPDKPYARLRFLGARCVAIDGGFAHGVPMGNDGLPQFAVVAIAPPPCARAPFDGGLDCRRDEHDGGLRFLGTGNIIQPFADAVGTQCEPCGCNVFYGDDPADL